MSFTTPAIAVTTGERAECYNISLPSEAILKQQLVFVYFFRLIISTFFSPVMMVHVLFKTSHLK